LSYPPDRESLERFLGERGLSLDPDIDYAVACYDGAEIVGAGALSGYVLKDIAVAVEAEGAGVASAIVSHLLAEEGRRGLSHLFVFTRPAAEATFVSLGFTVVARVPQRVVLLENREEGIEQYIAALGSERTTVPGISGSIVVNCNPFTLGHRYLIETAARECEVVHVFVVDEERSLFPADVRFRLVQEGVAGLGNVEVHHGDKYIISAATFPSYFLKEPSEVVATHALLDLTIFGGRIAPALGITRRFVGEEPYCEVTGTYNQIMQQLLPDFGIEVTVIPRLERENAAISASTVRNAIRDDNLDLVRSLVPPSTYEFLISEEAMPIVRRIKTVNSRH